MKRETVSVFVIVTSVFHNFDSGRNRPSGWNRPFRRNRLSGWNRIWGKPLSDIYQLFKILSKKNLHNQIEQFRGEFRGCRLYISTRNNIFGLICFQKYVFKAEFLLETDHLALGKIFVSFCQLLLHYDARFYN